MTRTVNIGICGLGTVGSGVVDILQKNQSSIDARAGCKLRIAHIGARRDNPNCDTSAFKVSRDIFAVASDPDVDIIIELIGGTTTAKELVLAAIASGKQVVSANKALLAECGNEVFSAAEQAGVDLGFEASVAGGIPIIKVLREGLAANEISWLAGIINGTGNFILTEMRQKGRAFNDVLAQAQELGYAEADPTFDIEGIDAAHKLAILASIAFGIPLQFEQTYTEGISTLTLQDLRFAEELGYRVKHLGIARRNENGIELRVHPTLIPEKRLIANVDGVMNAVLVKGDAVGATLHYGAGAGREATASAVIADIIDLARRPQEAQTHLPALSVPLHALRNDSIVDIDAVQSCFYLRLQVRDEPGVLANISKHLSEAEISIEAVIQKQPEPGENTVPLVMLTNLTSSEQLKLALQGVADMGYVVGEPALIRMEALD